METVKWARAACESTSCVEIAPAGSLWGFRPHGAQFALRATELEADDVVWMTRAELASFLAGVKAGDFDHLVEE